MARKSNDLDIKMLEVGKKLLLRDGLTGFSIRDLTKRAGVNLGMFSYHFGTKEEFLKRLLLATYGPFVDELNRASDSELALQEILFSMAKFSRDHSQEISAIVRDLLGSEKSVLQFLSKNFSGHLDTFQGALLVFLKTENLNTKKIEHVSRFLLGSVIMPNLILQLKTQLNARAPKLKDSDEELRARVSVSLAAVRTLALNRT